MFNCIVAKRADFENLAIFISVGIVVRTNFTIISGFSLYLEI